jgi:hypothetical protein
VPLAILGNVVRILSICLVAACTSADFALGFYHDYSGYVVFVVAIACMVACGEIITRWCARRRKADGEGAAGAPLPADAVDCVRPAAGEASVAPIVFAALLCPLLLFQLRTPRPEIAEPPPVAWPDSLAGYVVDDMLHCQNESCARVFLASQIGGVTNCPVPGCGAALDGRSLGENTVLPPDTTILKRVYTSERGMQFVVSAVISGAGKSSIHRPELCLPAQGVQMSNPTDFNVAGRPYHAIQVNFQRDPPSQLMYTFFNQEGVHTASHLRRIFLDTWDRSVHNRVDRWVMVTVRASSPYGVVMSRPRDRAEIERFLRTIGEVLP